MTTPRPLSQSPSVDQPSNQPSTPAALQIAPIWTRSDLAVCQASRHHATAITRLINAFAEQKLMLHREVREVRAIIHQFQVALATDEGSDQPRVVGCGALTPYSPAVAEIRSLCVDQTYHGGGVGTAVTRSLVQTAEAHGHAMVVAVTKTPQFFTRLGFRVLTPEEYPADFLDHGIRSNRRTLKNKFVVGLTLA